MLLNKPEPPKQPVSETSKPAEGKCSCGDDMPAKGKFCSNCGKINESVDNSTFDTQSMLEEVMRNKNTVVSEDDSNKNNVRSTIIEKLDDNLLTEMMGIF